MRPYYKNILLLSGTGRNVGKTSFVCTLLKHFSNQRFVTVKVSPHWHSARQGAVILFEDKHVLLMREDNLDSHKDTSRMLRCGAAEVFYLQHVGEEALMKAFRKMMSFGIEQQPLIIESAILARHIKPALHLRITRSDVPPSDKPVIEMPFDKLVTFNGKNFDLAPGQLRWDNENFSWSLR